MWNKIFNPKTKRFVNVNGKIGKDLLKKYLFVLNHKNQKGGGIVEFVSWDVEGDSKLF